MLSYHNALIALPADVLEQPGGVLIPSTLPTPPGVPLMLFWSPLPPLSGVQLYSAPGPLLCISVASHVAVNPCVCGIICVRVV